MALISIFLKIIPTAWKVAKPFISTSKKTIDVIDTATTLIEKRTSSLTKYVFVITLGYLSVEQREALATIVSAFMENAKTTIIVSGITK
jgi:hypothetical protein